MRLKKNANQTLANSQDSLDAERFALFMIGCHESFCFQGSLLHFFYRH